LGVGFHFLASPQKTPVRQGGKQKNASAEKIQLPTFSLLLKFPKLVVVPPPQTACLPAGRPEISTQLRPVGAQFNLSMREILGNRTYFSLRFSKIQLRCVDNNRVPSASKDLQSFKN
jgi:hypothetical protein